MNRILPDVYVQCEVCKGARFRVLQVKYKGFNISDVWRWQLNKLETFSAIPQAVDRLSTLVDVGLGYVKNNQPLTIWGEAQRVKLATEWQKSNWKNLYLIDEPTTGLSFYDVHKLMDVIQRLLTKVISSYWTY